MKNEMTKDEVWNARKSLLHILGRMVKDTEKYPGLDAKFFIQEAQRAVHKEFENLLQGGPTLTDLYKAGCSYPKGSLPCCGNQPECNRNAKNCKNCLVVELFQEKMYCE